MSVFDALDKSLVWITLINHGYVDYTKNFLIAMEKAQIDMTLVVYCTDAKSMTELAGHARCICLDAQPFLTSALPTDLKEWEDIDYKRITFAKLDAIRYTLHQTRPLGVQAVGFIDTDIILLKDPTPVFLRHMAAFTNIAIFSQCDENGGINGRCSNRLQCPCLCSGVIVFRNTSAIDPLLAYDESDITRFMCDQHFLLHNFRRHGATCLTLEKDVLLNGSFPGVKSDVPLIVPDSACLIHFNWMVGHEKRATMKKRGMWYVDISST